jgi:tetratricopeptide (TPR) repeat protein
MKPRLLLLTVLALITSLLAFRVKEAASTNHSLEKNPEYRNMNIVRCTPDWNELKEWLEETNIPPIPGAGTYKWKITTRNDSAQFYFNQGINMYYGFHIIESMASFKKASKFDPNCAMLYWAQALAYGPNINDFGYRASPGALAAISKAVEFEEKASPFEKALIDAMAVRYTSDSADATRAQLNEDYTGMMQKIAERFPANPDAKALYADAMMLQHPWDLWNKDGTAKPWTLPIRQVLEKLLVQSPYHPGANHYYIHVMEPSPFADKALPSAGRLGVTNPALSHLVHMPSHIYLRTGNYQQGVLVNTKAVNSYKKVAKLFAPVTGNDFLYVIHNLHMKANNAMLAGQYKNSIEAANETKKSIPADYLSIPPPMGNYLQYIDMTPVLVFVRFGKWDELMKISQPGKEQVFGNIMYHFGRGMAQAGKSDLSKAIQELNSLIEFMKDTSLNIPFIPFSPAIDAASVAEKILVGTITLKQGNYEQAIAAFKEAVTIEENMVYNEPRDWMLNPKHFLGNAYLQAGMTKEVKEVLEKDLSNNKENGWALYGIWQALTKEKRTPDATKVLARYKKAFSKADVKPTAPVF